MTCQAAHTKYQPDDTWICPKCGAGSEIKTSCIASSGFIINNADEEADQDCGLLHKNDEVRCFSCGYEASGEFAARAMAKKAHMETCPTCRGTGMVHTRTTT